jgi:hypothetical protein
MESDEKITKITTIDTKTVHVKIEYWDCGDGHHHKTEDSARRCVGKKEKRKAHQLQRDAIYARNICCTRKVLSGSTFKNAGVELCISACRVGQIVERILRRAHRLRESGHPLLPTNILEARKHKDEWLKRIDLLVAAHWGEKV